MEAEKIVSVRFKQPECNLIIQDTFATPDLTQKLGLEFKGKKTITVEFSLDELDDLIGFIAAEANHTSDDILRQKLDKLFARLVDVLERNAEIEF